MTIRFSCSCGNPLQAAAEQAGKQVRCPACLAVATVPAAEAAPPVREDAVQAGSPPLASQDADASFRPRRSLAAGPYRDDPWDDHGRRSASGSMVWVWPCLVGLLLLVGLGAGWWYFYVARDTAVIKEETCDKLDLAELVHVPANALGFVSTRLADLWEKTPLKSQMPPAERERAEAELKKALGLDIGDLERVTIIYGDLESLEKALGDKKDGVNFGVLVATRKPVERALLEKAVVPKGVDETIKDLPCKVGADGRSCLCVLNENLFVINSRSGMQAFAEHKAAPVVQGPLRSAIVRAARNKDHVNAGVNLSALSGKLKSLPVPGPFQDLFKSLADAESAALAANYNGDLSARLYVQFPGAALAKSAQKSLQDLIELGLRNLPKGAPKKGPDLLGTVAKILSDIRVEVHDGELQVALEVKDMVPLTTMLVPAIQKVREAANRTRAINNLRQLAVAMHSYHTDHKRLPPPVIGKGLSWRVAILPYMGQEGLYRRFNLDEPWDGPTNLPLLHQMPMEYHPVVGPVLPPNTTPYQVFTGPQTPFHGGVQGINFPDGNTLTFLIVEARKPVPWTAPQDLEYRPAKVLAPLGGQFPGVFLAAFGDAVVYPLPEDLDLFTVHAYATHNGGEKAPSPAQLAVKAK